MKQECYFDIFISFKDFESDKHVRTTASKVAEELYDILDIRGYKPFFSRVSLLGMVGEQFKTVINGALDTAKLLILVFSSAEELNAEWVKYEWKYFLKTGKSIIPVYKNVSDWEKVPYDITKLQCVDLTDDKEHTRLEKMLESIRRIMDDSVDDDIEDSAVENAEKNQYEPSDAATKLSIQTEKADEYEIINVDHSDEDSDMRIVRRKRWPSLVQQEAPVSGSTEKKAAPTSVITHAAGSIKKTNSPAQRKDSTTGLKSKTVSANSNVVISNNGINVDWRKARRPSVPDFKFTLFKDGIRLDKYRGYQKEIVIPDNYDGVPVICICNKAFYECKNLTSIVIPSSVTSIGDRAFYECRNLTSIVIPSSVTSIGYEVFSSCESMTSIVIPDSATSIGDRAFLWCRNLTSIVIPDSVISIGVMAFSWCRNLTSIVIPDSVMSIGESAFHDCKNLTVKCSHSSYAQSYCEKNKIRYILAN